MKQHYLALIIALSIFSGCSTSSPTFQSVYMGDLEHNQAVYLSNFEEIHAIVERKHPFVKTKGLQPDSLYKKYSNLIAKAENNTGYGKLMLRYFGDLQNGHSNVYFRRGIINCSAVLIENRVFFSNVWDDRFADAGIQERDEILEIDGIPVLEWLEREKAYVSASTEQGRTALAISNNIFTSYMKDTRRYLVRTADSLQELVVAFDDRASKSVPGYTLAVGKSISENIGYIAINGMRGNVVEQFTKHYQALKHKPFLIIDLRNNGGGSSSLGEEMSEYLIKQKYRASVSRKALRPNSGGYNGNLFVLTSGYTFSSAESFAIDLREGAEATLIGTPTHGDTGNGATMFATSQGTTFRIPTRELRFSAGGFPMEGKSIPPTYLVEPTVDDFLKGEDTVLHYTLQLINQGIELKAESH